MTHDEINRAVVKMLALKDGWDGDAPVPSRRVVMDASTVAHALVTAGFEVDDISADEDNLAGAKGGCVVITSVHAELVLTSLGARTVVAVRDRASHDDLKAEALQAEVAELKSLCRATADMLEAAPWQRGGLALVSRLRKAGAS